MDGGRVLVVTYDEEESPPTLRIPGTYVLDIGVPWWTTEGPLSISGWGVGGSSKCTCFYSANVQVFSVLVLFCTIGLNRDGSRRRVT